MENKYQKYNVIPPFILIRLFIKSKRQGNSSGHSSGQSYVAIDATAILIAVQIFLWESSNVNKRSLRMTAWKEKTVNYKCRIAKLKGFIHYPSRGDKRKNWRGGKTMNYGTRSKIDTFSSIETAGCSNNSSPSCQCFLMNCFRRTAAR